MLMTLLLLVLSAVPCTPQESSVVCGLKHPLILTKPSDSKWLRIKWVGEVSSNYGRLRK